MTVDQNAGYEHIKSKAREIFGERYKIDLPMEDEYFFTKTNGVELDAENAITTKTVYFYNRKVAYSYLLFAKLSSDFF